MGIRAIGRRLDIVYICRRGNNEELRYSIRSVVKNLPHDNIWLIGYKPDWYVGNFIPLADKYSKYKNIRVALGSISDSEGISEDFVLMNDDFFVIRSMERIEPFNGGLLKDKVDQYRVLHGSGTYLNLIENTYSHLVRTGIKDPIDYDIHVPMPMSKSGLKNICHLPCLPQSLFGNINNIGGKTISDVKHYDTPKMKSKSYDYINGDLPFISTEDRSFKDVYDDVLRDMFPDPSPYEFPQ